MPAQGDLRVYKRVWNGATYTVTDVSNTPVWDWEANIQGGTQTPYDTPNASSCTLRATYESTQAPVGTINIGTILQLQIYNGVVWTTMFTGYVSEIATAYSAYGVVKDLVQTTYTLVGALGMVLNQTWYNGDATSQATYTQVGRIFAAINTQMWSEVDRTLTWATTSPSITWSTWDRSTNTILGALNVTGSTTGFNCSFPVGLRSVWDDLVTLMLQSHSVIAENADGSLTFYVNYTMAATSTIDASNADPSLTAYASRSEIRNNITVDYNGGSLTSSELPSVQAYGIQDGSITTVLDNPTDALTIANYTLGALSSPTYSLRRIAFDYLNPALSGTLGYSGIIGPVTFTNLPASFSSTGTETSLVCGYNWNISKYSIKGEFDLFRRDSWQSSFTWQTIGAAYTWTSYGAAFPTTKWSDL